MPKFWYHTIEISRNLLRVDNRKTYEKSVKRGGKKKDPEGNIYVIWKRYTKYKQCDRLKN